MTSTHIVRPESADDRKQVADATPTLVEPIAIAEWWKNRRGDSIRLVLSQFQGTLRRVLTGSASGLLAHALDLIDERGAVK
jgi:hypothetical protein